MTRYRRGLQSGLDLERSAVLALNTSGRAVLFAGGTVCISLLGLLVLAILFGLSMDYQVFLVSRTAEEWSRTP